MPAFDATSWLLFSAVLINQMGRVMIPAIKTSVLADAVMGAEFEDKVGAQLSFVSIVCLAGKLLGAAFTDRLGGWPVLISVFGIWIFATFASIYSQSVDIFGLAWWLNSFAYTITWGAIVQVIGAVYTDDKQKSAQLAFTASASRFGATIGNVFFGQLLTAGFHWRSVQYPMLPLQALLLLFCGYKFAAASAPAVEAPKSSDPKSGTSGEKKAGEPPAADVSILGAFLSLDFWLMLIPKTVTFTYTQFFMNYLPQLLHTSYGFDHGMAATLGGVAQGGSVIGLLGVGEYYKRLTKSSKALLVLVELLLCALVPFVLSLGPSVLPQLAVVPLTVLWGLAYALPFYIPPGEFAMQIGGKKGTALFTNIFDASGFAASALWNPWASALAKNNDFKTILYSQALFGAISSLTMPLCMYRQMLKEQAAKKKE